MLIARFMASMMMHINVEMDIRAGLNMMKYAVNHYKDFTSVYPAFLIAFLLTIIDFLVELNVMVILSSMNGILDVVMKYVSLAVISKIPANYFNSLSQHKLKITGHKLKITKFRHKNPLEGAPCGIYVLRIIYKFLRLFFCTCSFYFMPFMAIFLNF